MIIEIEILDGSPELEELEFVVNQVNERQSLDAESLGAPVPELITLESYVTPIVLRYFKKRVQDHYLQRARTTSNSELQDKFGKSFDVLFFLEKDN